jgi:membrane protein implicated in regulation of membrane protease activity
MRYLTTARSSLELDLRVSMQLIPSVCVILCVKERDREMERDSEREQERRRERDIGETQIVKTVVNAKIARVRMRERARGREIA